MVCPPDSVQLCEEPIAFYRALLDNLRAVVGASRHQRRAISTVGEQYRHIV